MSAPPTQHGRQLYALLPEVYRNRDAAPERQLAHFLDPFGGLLDQIRTTLRQRLADSFPDNPDSGLACQDWILPYFAQLLDVNLVSPHVEGRREEVTNAVRWRQRKGTVLVLEEIAEAIGHQAGGAAEAEVHEGYERAAVTPRIGWPLLPATALGADEEPNPRHPADMATHPGLPAVTPDFTRASRAVLSERVDENDKTWPDSPAARASLFGGEKRYWILVHPHGVPCFPGSFDDRSRRTIDIRTLDWRRGHIHPRRVLLFAPPPVGFFELEQATFDWSDRADHPDHVTESDENDVHVVRNPTGDDGGDFTTVTLTQDPTLEEAATFRIEHLNFLGTITVEQGRLILRNVAAKKLIVQTDDDTNLVLDAVDCLFETIEAEKGRIRLEYCTVIKRLVGTHLQASDCILPNDIEVTAEENAGCIRYSRVPDDLEKNPDTALLFHRTTTEEPIFFGFKTCTDAGLQRSASVFGNPGYGVLHPATPESICFGAEDGGEMGAYHHRRHCLQNAAAMDKLDDFLPLGVEAVLIPDSRLLQPPPKAASDHEEGP